MARINPKTRGCLLILSLFFAYGCGSTPQITESAECMKCADALYTAVTAKNIRLVEQCAAELQRLRDANELPHAADKHLQAIIAKAQAGDWDSAAKGLHAFIRQQRRPKP